MALPPIPQRVEGQTPEQELQQWAQWRLAVEALPGGVDKALGSADPNDPATVAASRYYNGPSPRPGNPAFDQAYASEMFSPEAGQAYVNAKTHFDIKSGKTVKNQSGWDLPETKMIVLMAAGMAGGIAAPAIIGALGGGSAASGAAAAAPEFALSGAAPITGLAAPTAAGLSTGGAAAATTAAAGGGGSALSAATKLLSKKGLSEVAGMAGKGVGDATNTAANNRSEAANLAQRAQNSNVAAQSNYENELMARAREEDAQRKSALKNMYAASYAHNRTAGPNNTAGLTKYSPEYLTALDALAGQGGSTLSKAARYDAAGLDELKPQTVDVDEFMKKYGQPSTMEKVGNWLSPTLSTLGKVSKYF